MSYISKVVFAFEDGARKIVGDTNLRSFVCSENLTDANVSITPGVCEQYSDISLYDRDNFFHNRALAGGLKGAQVTVYLHDTSNNEDMYLGTYIVSKWNIEGDDSVIRITCRDTSHLFEYIEVPESDIANRTVKDLLDVVFNSLPSYSYQFLDEDTASRCNSITIPNSFYNQMSLLTLLNEICYVGMLRVYYDNNVFFIARCL